MSKRVVYDTNVIISAQLKSGSWPALVLDLALNNKVQAFTSLEILGEFEDVLIRDKFDFDKNKIKELMDLIKKKFKIIEPEQNVTAAKDKDDNKFLECALEGDADFLITGNKKDFPEEFKEIKIVNPTEFAQNLFKEIINSK